MSLQYKHSADGLRPVAAHFLSSCPSYAELVVTREAKDAGVEDHEFVWYTDIWELLDMGM